MLVAKTALLLRRNMLMVFIMTRMLVMVVHRFGLRPCNLASPELLPRHILFPVNVDVHLGGRDPAAHHSRYFEAGRHMQGCHRLFKQPLRNSGVDQRAHEHVAADAGKAFKVGYAHIANSNHSGARGSHHTSAERPLDSSVALGVLWDWRLH